MTDFRLIDRDDPDYIEKRNNRKLTADKIRQMLSKVLNNPTDSAKRWVWELMQNAKDVPNKFKRVSVKIILYPNKLEFKHNGDPFSLSNIFSLIQQVSSKDSSNADEEVTGKFGTGFISTHLLSEKIDVSGVVLHKGVYRKFNICLDRSGRTSEDMLPKIDLALEHVRQIEDDAKFPIIENYEALREEGSYDTVFTYYLSSSEKQKAALSGLDDLIYTLPVTLVNIPKVKSVKIVNRTKGISHLYQSDLVYQEANVKKVRVTISNSSGKKENKNFITYTNEDVSLSIEVETFEAPKLIDLDPDTPRLFRDFPLIGSSKFYHPFMLNGFKFNPTEDRGGILLHGAESHEAEKNRNIINSAYAATMEFVERLIADNASNRYVFALSRLPDEKWEEFSKEWYDGLQEQYRAFLLDQKLVETNEGCITLREATIPIHGSKKDTRITFYSIVRDFVGQRNVPKTDIIIKWIENTGPKDELQSWNHDIRYSLERFLEELQELENVEALQKRLPEKLNVYEWLNKVYSFLHDERETERFGEYKIIPNHNNEFKTLDDLYLEDKDSPIAEEFLDTLDVLEDYWRDDLIHRKIELPSQSVKKRDLSDASDQINDSIDSCKKGDEELLNIVIDITRNEGKHSTGESFKAKLFKIAKELFALEVDLRPVININGFNFDKAVEKVSNLINKKVSELGSLKELAQFINKDFDATVIWYNRYLELLEASETFKSHLEHLDIIPNRKGDFCAFDSVYGFGSNETPLDEKLINILFELDNSEDWNAELLHDGFSLTLETRKFEELGSKIDESLVELLKEDSYEPGSILPYKSSILDLINWIKLNPEKAEKYLNKTFLAANDLWVKFSMTNEIMDLLVDERNLELLQEISEANVSLTDVKQLMNIAGEMDKLGLNGFSKILEHAEDLLEVEQDFHFLRETGENIEELFKEALRTEGVNIGINHLSKGSHDFELYSLTDSSKRAFVEIKSYKYGTRNPFKFASSQIRKSLDIPEKYFVCMLERPLDNKPADVTFLKENLFYKSNLNELVSDVLSDIEAYEKIVKKDDDVKLVLRLKERPRIYVEYDLMINQTYSFSVLINDLKNQLT